MHSQKSKNIEKQKVIHSNEKKLLRTENFFIFDTD